MEIGTKIKRLRLQNNLTQEELADRCELTKGYISQLENELTSPSITTLEDILNALGTTFAEFFKDEKEEKVVFTEAEFIEKVVDTHKIEWLVPNAQKNEMEPAILSLAPGAETDEDMPHEGEEFGYVLEGKVWVTHGKRTRVCARGESFYYASDKTHKISNRSDKPARALWISSPPNL